ncbi:Uncharacterized protein SCG7109_AO_00080 [Chlamydiales bacterium SCGC AG-110-M15]|nr:Uncharacterized protein SCG7109_AO_00080 [Chlamydiales bacterium SCGC AG-110-M15]
MMKGIFLDIETTGLDPTRHRCLEIAFKIVDLKSGKEESSFESVIKQPLDVWNQTDPGSLEVTGFKWEELEKGIEEAQARDQIIKLINDAHIRRGNAFFICQNPSFDRSFFAQIIPVYTQEELLWPYHWLDFASMYWSLKIKHLNPTDNINEVQLSKNSIAKTQGIPPEAHPHRAMNGVKHLIQCYTHVVGWANKQVHN